MKTVAHEPWQVLSSREVYSAPPWIRVSRQKVRLPNGRIVDDYHKIQLLDYVLIVARTADGRVIVEKQYKLGLGRTGIYLPAGALAENEDSLDAARRELLEETGYVAENWRFIGQFTCNSSYGCGVAHIVTAENARLQATPDSGDLEEMEILLMSPEELWAAIRAGEMGALSNAAAIALTTHPKIFPQ